MVVLYLQFILNYGFIEEDSPSEKVVIVEEELNPIDIDDIRNLKNLPRFVFIDEKCGNRRVWSMMVKRLLEILTKRRGQTFRNSVLMFTL